MFDFLRFVRAVATNQLAALMPAVYVRLTKQTGRGDGDQESVADMAAYFRQSVDEYLLQLNVSKDAANDFLKGKTIVEYGPGDFPGVAILMLALGARKVYCVDRFSLIQLSRKNHLVCQELINRLDTDGRNRLADLFVDSNASRRVLNPNRIEYLVRPHGFSELHDEADLVLSRAVLEHVDDLQGTFGDMVRAMKPGSNAVHLVDLRSHGLHRENPLDFMVPSRRMWSLMYSNKGVPNRWRLSTYRDILSALPLQEVGFIQTQSASRADVDRVRPSLDRQFRMLADEDLTCLGFWVFFRKPSNLV